MDFVTGADGKHVSNPTKTPSILSEHAEAIGMVGFQTDAAQSRTQALAKEFPMIRHVFSWRVAEGHSNDDVIELLNTLREPYPYIQYWELGAHEGDPGDNGQPFSGVLINDFESWDDLQKYSVDEFHLEVVAKLKPKLAERAVVDFVREDG